MKRKPSKSGFTKLLAADTTINLTMNRIVAERLLSAVVEFLQAGKGDDAPTFAVERSQ